MMDPDEARAFEARMARAVAGPEIARLEAALTAERDARERAEREREEASEAFENEREERGMYQARVVDLEAERDTLRERVAVLQAECQAGRVHRLLNTTHTRDVLRQAERATDAAGAMGEVGRGKD